MTATAQWIPGPPPGRGRYWVHWNLKSGPSVEAVARLLIKTLLGAAYEFAANREYITHHMVIVPPAAPAPTVAPSPAGGGVLRSAADRARP